MVHFLKILLGLSLLFTLAACDVNVGEADSDGAQTGLDVEDGEQTIEPEFIGTWVHTTMSIEDGEPFEVPLITALRIERSLMDTEADGRPLEYVILIDQLQISKVEIARTQITRGTGGSTASELFRTEFTKIDEQILTVSPEAPEIIVNEISEDVLDVNYSDDRINDVVYIRE